MKGNRVQMMRKGTTMRYETIVTIKAKAYRHGCYGLVSDWYETLLELADRALLNGYDEEGQQVAADVVVDFVKEGDWEYYDGMTSDDLTTAVSTYSDALEIAAKIDAYNHFVEEWELDTSLPELTCTIELVDWEDDDGKYRYDGRIAACSAFGCEWFDETKPTLSMVLARSDSERVQKLSLMFETTMMNETMGALAYNQYDTDKETDNESF